MFTGGSDKSRLVALVLAGILGVFGAHRFYVGKTGTGILMLLTLGGMGLWYIYDVVLIAAGGFEDIDRQRVMYWTVDEALAAGGGPTSEVSSELLDEVDALRGEVAELAERVDFTERLLTKARKESTPL